MTSAHRPATPRPGPPTAPRRPPPAVAGRAALDRALTAWGDEPAPAPSGAFLAGLEARLLDADAGVEITVRPGLAPVVPLRRKAGITAVAAAGLLFVAGAAAAVGGLTRDDGVRVEPTVGTTEVSASVPTTSTVARSPDRTVAPVPVTAARTTVPGASLPVETSSVAPTTAAASGGPSSSTATVGPPRASVAPTTTRAPVVTPAAPTTAVVVEPTAPPTVAPATTTTEVHTAATMTMTCGAQVVDTRPAVVCEWSEPPGGASSYRLLRGVSGQPTGRVLSPTPGTRRTVDYDAVTAGTTYLYTAQALDGTGALIAHSTTVAVTR